MAYKRHRDDISSFDYERGMGANAIAAALDERMRMRRHSGDGYHSATTYVFVDADDREEPEDQIHEYLTCWHALSNLGEDMRRLGYSTYRCRRDDIERTFMVTLGYGGRQSEDEIRWRESEAAPAHPAWA